jgi:uncharacterized repeat protein (TIGR01451 family)
MTRKRPESCRRRSIHDPGTGRRGLWRYVTRAASAGFAALLCGSSPAWAQTVGNAQSFAIMGGSAVNANGTGSVIDGDVGVAPAAGTFITGFPANATVVPPFSVRGNDSSAIAARASITALYSTLGSTAQSVPDLLPELSGVSLGPGVYHFAAQATLSSSGTGNLTLTTPGLYIFKVGSSLTTATTTHVILGAGVDPCNVFWQVTSLATLNGVNFVGNVVADAGITLGTGVNLVGRALATANGPVTMAGSDIIGGCSAAAAPPPAPSPTPTPTPTPPVPAPPAPDLFIVKSHTTLFTAGTNATYSIALFNGGGAASSGAYTVVDTLPAGLTFVSATGVGWSCAASGQTVTCTSSTVLQAAGPGPNSIALTVLPDATAVPSVTNRATVSGGSDSVLTNNTTADVAVVAPAGPLCPPITLAPITLEDGIVGVPFTVTLTASGGTAPYAFSVTGGALPAGVTLTPAGVLSGTATTAGAFTVTLRATDANGCFLGVVYTANIITAVPTLSEWAMITLTVLLAAAGVVALRRRGARPW